MKLDALKSLEQAGVLNKPSAVTAAQPAQSFDMLQTLQDGVGKVNQQINQADKMSQDYLLQGKGNLHEVIISLEQADLSFRYMQQIRNKVLESYNDIMRMQV